MATAAPAAFGPRDILGILRRRIWIIVIFVILGAIGGGAAWWLLRRYAPVYVSRAQWKCQVPNLETTMRPTELRMSKDAITLATEEQAQRVKSAEFLQDVLTQPSIKNTNWFAKYKNNPAKQLEELQQDFSAAPGRNTPIVVMSMQARSATEAQGILTIICEAWWNRIKGATDGDANEKLGALRLRKGTIRNDRYTLNENRKNLLINAPPGWNKNVRTVVTSELEELRREKLVLNNQLQYLEIQQKQWQQSLDEQGTSPTVIAAIENDPYIRAYQAELSALQNQLSVLRDRLGEEHQQVRQTLTAMNNRQNQLAQRRDQLEGQYGRAQSTRYSLDIQALQQQLVDVNFQYEEIDRRQRDLDRLTFEALEIDRRLGDLQTEEEAIDSRIASFETARQSNDRFPALLVGRPNLPLQPSKPVLKAYLPGGIIAGVLAAFLLIMALEFMSDKIKTPTEVRRYLDVPFLGMIPEYDQDDADHVQLEKVAALQPQALISEAYRQIWTNLVFGAPSEKLRSILVTSGSAQCGKTTTALNLAITLAAQGKRALIIDANFRRPALNKLFGQEGPPRGLSHVLAGQASAADVIRPSGITGLDVVDAGPLPPTPAVMLGSDRMRKFLDNQKQYYDHIVVDGPPALLVSDARILAGVLDGTLMVVRAGQTPRGVVNRMVNEFKDNKIYIVGAVLNAVKPRRGGYFAKAYQSYHDYLDAEPATLRTLPEVDDTKAPGDNLQN